MPQSENKSPEEFSKTKVKNEMLALQDLGKKLIELNPQQLAKIDLPERLLSAIQLAHTLKTHEAKRRHLQYIGKLMRFVDPEPIRIAVAQIAFTNAQQTDKFHEVEKWRDRLIAEGDDALQEFMHLYGQADRQQIRQLFRRAQQDKKTGKNTGADTELFRYLRELITAS